MLSSPQGNPTAKDQADWNEHEERSSWCTNMKGTPSPHRAALSPHRADYSLEQETVKEEGT